MNLRSGPSPLSEADELALDALLSELHRPSKRPPDLSAQILQALSQMPLSPAGDSQLAGAVNQAAQQPAATDWELRVVPRSAKESGEHLPVVKRSRWRTAIAGLSVAASIGGLAFFATRHWPFEAVPAQPESSQALAQRDNATPTQPAEPTAPVNAAEVKPVPRNAIVLTQPSAANSEAVQPEQIQMAAESGSSAGKRARVSPQAVATELNRQLNAYWVSIGVQPTATASDQEIAVRLEPQLGFKPNVINGSIDEPLFASAEQAVPLATRLVSTLTDRLSPSDELKQKMIDEAAQSLSSGSAFDQLVATWVEQGHFLTPAQPQLTGEVVAEQLLNADLACARCHDSPVDSSLTQKDYWSFAACFKSSDQPTLFYELPDGRQRAADAAIPGRWTGLQTTDTQGTNPAFQPAVSGIASLLKDNPRLAQSLANHVWESIYGAPLVSLSSDPLAPPRDDSLQLMHRRLSTAIQESGFDLRTAYQIVINCDSMKRSTADLFAGDGWITASEQQLAQAGAQLRAFAARQPALPMLPRQELLVAMATKLGHEPVTLKDTDTVLAQPLMTVTPNGSGPQPSSTRPQQNDQERVWTWWLADRTAIQGSWLHWIKDSKQQRDHAFYAANLSPSPEAEQLAQRLQADEEAKDQQTVSANDRLMWALIKGR